MSDGLTTTDRLIVALGEEPWSSARELAEEVEAPLVTVCAILQALVYRGIVLRKKGERGGPERRVYRYQLVGEVPEYLL